MQTRFSNQPRDVELKYLLNMNALPPDKVQSPPSMQNYSKPSRTPLPTALPPLKELDLHARYYSSRIGGDFFDAVAAGPHVVFLLTDIAGTRSDAQAIAAAAQDA